MAIDKEKVKLLKYLLKEIEEDVELLNKALDKPRLYGINRRVSMMATNIRCRAEAIESYIYPRGLKHDAVIDETWDEETHAPKWYKDLGVLQIEDVEE